MPAIFGTIGTVLIKMLLALATETFIKKMVYLGLKKLSELTVTPIDNDIVKEMGKAWGLE
jgi:hypothetical protein